jgi:hypothetical protein
VPGAVSARPSRHRGAPWVGGHGLTLCDGPGTADTAKCGARGARMEALQAGLGRVSTLTGSFGLPMFALPASLHRTDRRRQACPWAGS